MVFGTFFAFLATKNKSYYIYKCDSLVLHCASCSAHNSARSNITQQGGLMSKTQETVVTHTTIAVINPYLSSMYPSSLYICAVEHGKENLCLKNSKNY